MAPSLATMGPQKNEIKPNFCFWGFKEATSWKVVESPTEDLCPKKAFAPEVLEICKFILI